MCVPVCTCAGSENGFMRLIALSYSCSLSCHFLPPFHCSFFSDAHDSKSAPLSDLLGFWNFFFLKNIADSHSYPSVCVCVCGVPFLKIARHYSIRKVVTVRKGWVCHFCCSWCRCQAHRQRSCPRPASAGWTPSHSSGPAGDKQEKRFHFTAFCDEF